MTRFVRFARRSIGVLPGILIFIWFLSSVANAATLWQGPTTANSDALLLAERANGQIHLRNGFVQCLRNVGGGHTLVPSGHHVRGQSVNISRPSFAEAGLFDFDFFVQERTLRLSACVLGLCFEQLTLESTEERTVLHCLGSGSAISSSAPKLRQRSFSTFPAVVCR